jgi:hypothetical protein
LKRAIFAYCKRDTGETALSAQRLTMVLHVFQTAATGQPSVSMRTSMVHITARHPLETVTGEWASIRDL